MNRSLSALVLLGLFVGRISAAEPKSLEPILDEQTVAVLAIDPAKVNSERFIDHVALALKMNEKERNEVKAFWKTRLEAITKSKVGGIYLVVSLADILTGSPFFVIEPGPGANLKEVAEQFGWLRTFLPVGRAEPIGKLVLFGSEDTIKRLRTLRPTKRPDMIEALGTGDSIRAAGVLPTDGRRILEETLPTLPKEFGGGSIRPIARGLKTVRASFDPVKFALTLSVEATDAKAATELQTLLEGSIKRLGSITEIRAALPGVDRWLALWKPRVNKERLELTLEEKTLVGLIAPPLRAAREAELRKKESERIGRLVKAMHEYEAVHGRFPAAANYDAKGKPLLSWRVHILPWLGKEAKDLHKEFKLDEPWDSPTNKKLLARMPAIYRPTNEKLAGEFRTTFLVPTGKETMFHGQQGVRVVDVYDGTSVTIAIVEADEERAVPWTRPVDLSVHDKQPTRGLATHHAGSFLIAFASGDVRFLPANLDASTLRALFTRAGGEVVNLP